MSSFGVLLRQFRLTAGLTQEVLAARACLSKRAIQHLERGLGQPHRETSRRLAEALTLSADQLRVFEALAVPAPRRPRRRPSGPSQGSVRDWRRGQDVGRDIANGAGDEVPSNTSGDASIERRLVTVVFADIVEPARYFQVLGPEGAVNLLDAMLRSMRSAVGELHGSVTRIDHQAMTVLFGAGTDHRVGALAACRAAAAMSRAVRRIPRDHHGWHTVEPQVRLGIASGEVVLRLVNAALSTEYVAAGLPFHIAARMARLSTPLGICLSSETMRLVAGHVQVRVLDPVPASGADQATAAYELLALGTDQPSDRPLETPVLTSVP